MKLFTKPQYEKLVSNGQKQQPVRGTPHEIDFRPVVKLFTPDAGATWLLTEILPENPDLAFGLCDLGLGHPEMGLVSLDELSSLRGRLGMPVERDRWFHADRQLSVYAREAIQAGRIIA